LLAELLQCEPLKEFKDSNDWFSKRDSIKTILANRLISNTTSHWLSILEKADIWCAPVMDYDMLVKQEGYRALDIEVTVKTSSGLSVKTTRCPIRVDGKLLVSDKGAPALGENNKLIDQQFGLIKELQESN
jgi:crotonobetainyl-CoA:carnitine CoA-transferase CaiB-like acyl-CoA transferase